MTSPCALIVDAYPFPDAACIARLTDALARHARVVVALTGAHRPRSPRLPWTVEERANMLRVALPPEQWDRLRVVGLREHLYQPERRKAELDAQLRIEGAHGAVMVWRAPAVEPEADRERRADYLRGGAAWRANTPEAVIAWLEGFRLGPAYARLHEEQAWMDKTRESWAAAPYPPIFVTADSVVTWAGQVLVIQRRHAPGAGLWALPGGFVEQRESLQDAALRELHEEAGLTLEPDLRKRMIRTGRIFDHPDRSIRGRSITFGLWLDLTELGVRPEVASGDDAAQAEWWPFAALAEREAQLVEDHVDIIRALVPEA